MEQQSTLKLSQETKEALIPECIRLVQMREPVTYWLAETKRKLELQESFHSKPFDEELKQVSTHDLNLIEELKNKTPNELEAFLTHTKDDNVFHKIKHNITHADIAVQNVGLQEKTDEEIDLYIKTIYCPEYAAFFQKLEENKEKIRKAPDRSPQKYDLFEERDKIQDEMYAFRKKLKIK